MERVEERHHGQRVADAAMKTEEKEKKSCRSATEDDDDAVAGLLALSQNGRIRVRKLEK